MDKIQKALELIEEAEKRAQEKYTDFVNVKLPREFEDIRFDQRHGFITAKINRIQEHLKKSYIPYLDTKEPNDVLAPRLASILFSPINPEPLEHLKNRLADRIYAIKCVHYLNGIIEIDSAKIERVFALFYYYLHEGEGLFPELKKGKKGRVGERKKKCYEIAAKHKLREQTFYQYYNDIKSKGTKDLFQQKSIGEILRDAIGMLEKYPNAKAMAERDFNSYA